MSERLTAEELASLRVWLEQWGPVGVPNWCDPEGNCVPVTKTFMAKLLYAAQRGVDGFTQDGISYTEAHGAREGA